MIRVRVNAGDYRNGRGVYIINDVGGTSELPAGQYMVEVTGGFHDYETGEIVHGRLLDEAEIEAAREAGTTGYATEDDRGFDPARVMFNARAIEEVLTDKEVVSDAG